MGKILFEPKELQQKFHEIYTFCIDNEIDIMVDCIGFDSYEVENNEDFDFGKFLSQEEFEEDIYITEDTIILITLPRSEENEETSIGDFYDVIQNALQGKIEDDYQFISPRLALVHIMCDFILLEKLNHQAYSIKQQWGNNKISVSIVKGLTSFGIRLTLDGDYDEYYPPVWSEDTFIEVRTTEKIEPQIFDDIVQSYIFELQSAFLLSIKRSIRINRLLYLDDESTDKNQQSQRMRPLMNGRGISSLLKIYNSCNEVADDEFRILTYTKVIEYVSQTVIRKEMLDSVLKKLYSPNALQPNATYILELEQLYDEHRNNKKDHQAIRLTIETCCDLSDLLDIVPLFLTRLNELKKKRGNKELRSICIEELATAISDTRNMIAHAKTNYRLKGKECPSDQLTEFAQCLKVVALQVIRWFSRQHEDSRIV